MYNLNQPFRDAAVVLWITAFVVNAQQSRTLDPGLLLDVARR